VWLEVDVDQQGAVTAAQVIATPHAELTESAVAAVRQWVYQTTLLNGNPVPVRTVVRVNYTLMP
jgi:TonB family protein